MLTERFLLGRGRSRLSPDDRAALDEAMQEVRSLPPRHLFVRHGVRVEQSALLLEGYMCRYMDDREGRRQLVAVHVPGDFVDLHAFPMKWLDHDVATLGPAKVGVYSHRALETMVEQRPALTRALWFSTLLDAAMHREWIFRLGRLGAEGRIAHFISELEERLAMVGLSTEGRFSVPLIQADLAEACGMTSVHVNRVLRTLREGGLMVFRSGDVEVLDRAALHRLAEFDAAYLYGGGVPDDEDKG